MKITNDQLINQLNDPCTLNEDTAHRYKVALEKAEDRKTKSDDCLNGKDVYKALERGEVPPDVGNPETSDIKEYWDGFRIGCHERVEYSNDFRLRVAKEIHDQSHGQPIMPRNQGYIDGYLLYDRHLRKETSNEFGPPNKRDPNCLPIIYEPITWSELGKVK
jgi:hypothetical protein